MTIQLDSVFELRYNVNVPKKATSVRLTDAAARLLAELAAKMGLSQAGVLEVAIRDLAKRKGVSPK